MTPNSKSDRGLDACALAASFVDRLPTVSIFCTSFAGWLGLGLGLGLGSVVVMSVLIGESSAWLTALLMVRNQNGGFIEWRARWPGMRESKEVN